MVRPSSLRSLNALVLGLLLSWSARSSAQSRAEGIDLRYEAPPGCPDRDALARSIHDRAPRGFPSADDRSFRVRIERTDDVYQGRLEIERKRRVLSAREISGPTCEVVATAIAVFVAIALDPAEVPLDVEPPPEPPPPRPRARRSSPPPPEPAAAPVTQPTAGWYWSSGVDVTSEFHPAAAWGGRVHAEVTRLAAGALVAPELRLSWGWNEFDELPRHGGVASFRFQTGRAEACALVDRAPLVVSTCAGFEAGTLAATTRNLPRAGGTREGWYAPTAIVHPGWFLFDWLSLDAEVGLLFPLTRASFVVADPERTVYRVPRVAVTAGFGIRIWARFP